MQNGIGLLPNCIVKKKILYCNLAIVLQEKGVVGWFVLQCTGIVLQYRTLTRVLGHNTRIVL